jgi:hypothetical protein
LTRPKKIWWDRIPEAEKNKHGPLLHSVSPLREKGPSLLITLMEMYKKKLWFIHVRLFIKKVSVTKYFGMVSGNTSLSNHSTNMKQLFISFCL